MQVREFSTSVDVDAKSLREVLRRHGLTFEECRPFPWTRKVFVAVGAVTVLEAAAQEIAKLAEEMWWNRQW